MTTDDTQQPFDEVLDPPQDGGAEAAAVPSDTPEQAAASLEAKLTEERDTYRDQLLRARADFDNYRKRVERERAQMTVRAAEEALRDILPIIDDLERAIAADAGHTADSFRDGVRMIHRQMLDMLKRRGVEPVDAIGQDFDPNVHEAVAYEPAEGRREGEIIGELRRGYRMGDRLLRPAMVRVAQETH
ncbi:MAG: nucleotide exchange factor GrpE [Acidobacteriota bacterium]|nr:nucleotide exchange factor GrpE [Acidobacteriota bacterium]